MNSPDHDCATQVMYTLPSAEAAKPLRQDLPERDRRQDRPPHLHRMGPGADGRRRRAPGDEPLQHAGQRRVPADLHARTCAPARSTSSTAPSWWRRIRSTRAEDIDDIIHNIDVAARVALAGMPLEEADLRAAAPVDVQKFDLKVDA